MPDITDVDISDSWLKRFMAICRSNMSAILIALRLLRIIAIFDFATAVKSSIADTNAEKLTPFFLCGKVRTTYTGKVI